jgi:hypothetical protein
LLLSDIRSNEDYNNIKQRLFALIADTDQATQDDVEESINDFNNSALSLSKNKDDIEKEIENHKNMANVFGIELNNDDDEIAQIINLGIKDINPGRVLKNCVHLFVMLRPGGKVSEWMNLPSAGMKILICTKHKYRWESMSLDRLYNIFEIEHCKKCSDKQSHPDDWKWSRDWQLKQNKIYKK